MTFGAIPERSPRIQLGVEQTYLSSSSSSSYSYSYSSRERPCHKGEGVHRGRCVCVSVCICVVIGAAAFGKDSRCHNGRKSNGSSQHTHKAGVVDF